MPDGKYNEDMSITLVEVIIIAIGLTLDVCAYCLYKGAMLSRIDKKEIAKLVACFTSFQMLALLLGNSIRFIPLVAASYQKARTVWLIVSALLFLGLGIWMVIRSYRHRHDLIVERNEDTFHYRIIVLWACLTSIDALIAGIGFGILSLDILVLLVVIGVVTALSVILGIYAGYRLGCDSRHTFVTIGGCIVLAGGADVLLRILV